MRLPADATLIVVAVQEAVDDPRQGARNNAGAEANIARLIARWRAEGLPLVHVRHDSVESGSPYAPGAPGHRFKPCAAPREGENVVAKSAASAFIGPDFETALDAIGATTLAICGALTADGVEAAARHAGGLGYRAFVVADACWSVDTVDLAGGRWTAEEAHALALARLHGEYATVVDTASTLDAAALAMARRRRGAPR
ncbi:nicotinamidase-related amidase [Roseiarcus fermentans]|uniref:Nicotinamidase-related amidase n=1 Tax=Roseiarcus fermentans TaxID=1473586 RepID=A0A366FPD1_9HYPH|nr:isochorismatase family protein [Roseiarcus fermentans]RBP16553.1 nicotinamidase-related amidase [Roseiarcus fermentans]